MPWFGGTQKCDQGIGSVLIVESICWGEKTSRSYNWNLASLSTHTSSLEILVPIFTKCWALWANPNTYFFLSLTQHLKSIWQNYKSYSTLSVKWNSFLIPLHVGVGVPCFPLLTWASHKVHVLACIAQ